MNELTVINYKGKHVIDSRIVAEMVGKEHKHLLRDIQVYINALEISPILDTSNFFIPNTYKDTYDREQPCYLLTKKGCDMVANKMTGEKGIIFTAMYVTKFEEMENNIKESALPAEIMNDPIIAIRFEQIKMEQRLVAVETETQENAIKAASATEQAELAHKRINEMDNTNTIGDLRQRLVRKVQKYAERNGLTYSQGWKDFKIAYNTAFRTNITLRKNYYMDSRGITKMTIPEYLSATDKLPDALRVAEKMLQPVYQMYATS